MKQPTKSSPSGEVNASGPGTLTLRKRLFGYDQGDAQRALLEFASEVEKAKSELHVWQARIQELDSELRSRDLEARQLKESLQAEFQRKDQLIQELQDELRRKRPSADLAIPSPEIRDLVSKFLLDEVGPILAAAEESASRIVEQAMVTEDQKIRKADVLFDSVRSQAERFHRWWEQIDPIFRGFQSRLDDLGAEIDEVPNRVQLAVTPLAEAVNAVRSALMQVADTPRPPGPVALDVFPVTPERWNDLEVLFGAEGAFSGCWCMQLRLAPSQFASQLGKLNRSALESMVKSGRQPGLLAYLNGEAVAWCSLGPREQFHGLSTISGVRTDEGDGIWSVVCFYVSKPFRGRGIMKPLLEAAIRHARDHGAKIVEAYPVQPSGELEAPLGFSGMDSVFRAVGFVEVARPTEHQLIMRRGLEGPVI